MEPVPFGQVVRERRIQEGLSQEELAKKAGISRNYLSEIERGQATNLSWQVVERLSAVLGIKATQIPDTETVLKNLPPGLPEFARTAGLPPDDVVMLARVKHRGRQPTTPEKWELLYNIIRMVTSDTTHE